MVRKMKAIYHILNQFNQRDGGRVLIGECWMPVSSPHTTSDPQSVQYHFNLPHYRPQTSRTSKALSQRGHIKQAPLFHQP